jgi:hypothetical protein
MPDVSRGNYIWIKGLQLSMSSRNYCSLSAIRLIAASSLNMVVWRYLSPFFVLSERGKQSDLEIKLAMQRGHYLPKSRIRSRQSQDGRSCLCAWLHATVKYRKISNNAYHRVPQLVKYQMNHLVSFSIGQEDSGE